MAPVAERMGSSIPVAVFARAPRPGQVKTRLASTVGDREAARLYRAFLDDTLQTVRRTPGVRGSLWVAQNPDDPLLAELAGDLPRKAQSGGGLGDRIQSALQAMATVAGKAVVVGSDAPTLPPSLLQEAVRHLTRGTLVLGPTADGGYYLVGRGPGVPDVFERVRWSSRFALRDTVSAAHQAGVQIRLLPPWYDVDTVDDLRVLQAHLTLDPRAAPATAAVLGLPPSPPL